MSRRRYGPTAQRNLVAKHLVRLRRHLTQEENEESGPSDWRDVVRELAKAAHVTPVQLAVRGFIFGLYVESARQKLTAVARKTNERLATQRAVNNKAEAERVRRAECDDAGNVKSARTIETETGVDRRKVAKILGR